MASLNRAPDAYAEIRNGSLGNWTYSTVFEQELWVTRAGSSDQSPAYLVELGAQATVSSCGIEVTIKYYNKAGATYRCEVYNRDGGQALASQSFTAAQTTDPITHRFSFSGLSLQTDAFFFVISMPSDTGSNLITAPTATASFTYAALGVRATPSTLYSGNNVSLSFDNRFGQNIAIQFRHGSTGLDEVTAGGSLDVYCPDSWFARAGVADASMRVDVAASDALGRTASTSFVLKKAQGSSAAPLAPRGTSINGTAANEFTWSYSGDGAQTKAELQLSYDNTNWSDLVTINGSAQSWSCPAYSFRSGSVYWRVRVTNSFGLEGAWSSGASFTYAYPALSVYATPSSLYTGNGVRLDFENRLGRNIAVTLKNGITPLRSLTASGSVSVQTLYSWFETAGVADASMRVDVTATDDLGRTASAWFILQKPQGSTATPTAPRNTSLDGSGTISFAWAVSGDGEQAYAYLSWSPDNVSWYTLAYVENSATTWTAPAVTFPAGTIYWRVRVTNTYGIDGPDSASASFTVYYSATSQVVPVNSQTSGAFARGAAKTFQAALETTGPVYAPFSIASAEFRWRAGTSGDWTSAAMTVGDDGRTASVTVPANTFPAGDMQWQISATDNTGRTTETGVYTLSSLTSEVEAAPLTPINTVASGNSPIIFRWSYRSVDGSTQSRAQLGFSLDDGATWPGGANIYIYGSAASWEAPADFFPAGRVAWRVRSANADSVWGAWSEPVSFKVLGAPKVDGVTGDGKPFLTISWQTPTQSEYGQQAYKIRVDGRLYGPYFGADARSYTLNEPLEDGAHRIAVAAQNRFGLWSEWAEGNVVVRNVPGVSFNVFAQQTPPSPAAQIIMFTPAMAPVITRQPQDYRTTTSPARFAVSYKTSGPIPGAYGCTVTWQYRTGPGAVWQSYTGQTLADTAMVQVTQAMDGYQYRARLSNRAGEIYSDPATFYYGEPAGYASELREGEWKAATGYFLIYRDGKLIAKTYNNYFTDWAAIGTVSYKVLQVIPGGYYTRGTIVQGTVEVSVDAPTLIPLEADGRYLALTLSEDARRAQEVQRARETVWTQYEGSVYPEAETSVHESLSASGDGAWPWEQKKEADYFDSLLGKTVIYKTPGGVRVVGVLSGYTRRDADRKFYLTARFSIQQADWRDFVDEP